MTEIQVQQTRSPIPMMPEYSVELRKFIDVNHALFMKTNRHDIIMLYMQMER